jgi:DNA-binding NtrC family response regulator
MSAVATILLVDDEPLMRQMTAAMLSEEGHEVRTAADAKEALEILREHGSVSVVITDVNMPGMNGIELAEVLGRERPGTKVIFASGREDLAPALARTRHQVLMKPYSMVQLLDAVALELGRE